MEEAFGIVLFIVVALAVVAAAIAITGTGNLYRQIGRGGLSLDRESDHRRPAASTTSRAEADAEVRQMLEARNARRIARGEEPLDIEAEIARLSAPTVDPALESEIRALVIARNERRERQGKPPLDVEAEVRRQIQDLS